MHPIPILLHCLGSMTSGMTDYKLAMLISGVAGATLFVLVPKANLGFADQTSVRTLFGFIAGLTIWHALSFLRIRIIRLLLSYDHWFIGRPNFIDYVSDLFSTSDPIIHSFTKKTDVGCVFETVAE